MEMKSNYAPPQTDVLEIKFEGVVCTSENGSGDDAEWEN